jgi:hypothetical protein
MKKNEETKKTGTQQKGGSDQRDAGIAAENRPRPSQAEGDEETIDQDLERTGSRP